MEGTDFKAKGFEQVLEATERVVDTLAFQAKDAAEQLADALAAGAKGFAAGTIDTAADRLKDAARRGFEQMENFFKGLASKAKRSAGSLTGRSHYEFGETAMKTSSNGYHEGTVAVETP